MLALQENGESGTYKQKQEHEQQRRRIKTSFMDKNQEGSQEGRQEDFVFAEDKEQQEKILQELLVQKEVQENKSLLVDG